MAGDKGCGDGNTGQRADALRAEIAGELVTGVRGLPAEDVPGALCRSCTRLLPAVSGLSVSMLGYGTDAAVTLCASDEVAAALAEIQYTLGEGPCVEAARSGAPVFAADLTGPPDARRWPLFCSQAVAAGARAVLSVPLGGARGAFSAPGEPCGALGTLDVYEDVAGAPTHGQVRTVLLLADAVTLAVTALARPGVGSDGDVPWLAGAESDREEIHRAVGMIMVRLGAGPEEALSRLRARAFALGRTATDTARAVIDGTIDIRSD